MFDIQAAISRVFWQNMAEVKQEIVEHRKAGMRLPKKVAGQMGNHVFMQIAQLRFFLEGNGFAIQRSGAIGCEFQTIWKLVRFNKDGMGVAHVQTHRCSCRYCVASMKQTCVPALFARRSFLEVPWSHVTIEPIDPAIIGKPHVYSLDQWGLTVVLK